MCTVRVERVHASADRYKIVNFAFRTKEKGIQRWRLREREEKKENEIEVKKYTQLRGVHLGFRFHLFNYPLYS